MTVPFSPSSGSFAKMDAANMPELLPSIIYGKRIHRRALHSGQERRYIKQNQFHCDYKLCAPPNAIISLISWYPPMKPSPIIKQRTSLSCLPVVTCIGVSLPDTGYKNSGRLSFSSNTETWMVPVTLRGGAPPSWAMTNSW